MTAKTTQTHNRKASQLEEAPDALRIVQALSQAVSALKFTTPSHVYNPLEYAWAGQAAYLQRYGHKTGRVLLLGMNPGPWGMAQSGVPFGDIELVRDWLDLPIALGGPLPQQHDKYPILGADCQRGEGSGRRLWGWARQRFGTPEAFFQRFFIWNYCPLLFLAQGRNLIPEKLSAAERAPLFEVCDQALAQILHLLQPAAVLGIGRFAQKRAQLVLGPADEVGYLHHPSPANPRANADWASLAESSLAAWLPQG